MRIHRLGSIRIHTHEQRAYAYTDAHQHPTSFTHRQTQIPFWTSLSASLLTVFAGAEYMDALSLRDHMRIQTTPVPEVVVGCIASQLIAALAHLHKEWHRAHRDLKPGNILVDSRGLVRVTDLGQSKQMAATLGMMGSFVGAQVYMSPQRIQVSLLHFLLSYLSGSASLVHATRQT